MRVIRVEERFDPGDEFEVWPISDPHLGAPDCDEEALRRDIERIKKNPKARIIFMGDIGDLILPSDAKRFFPLPLPERYQDAIFAEGGIPAEVVAHAVEIFEPVADRIWGWLSGNHERSIRKYHSLEIGSAICSELKIGARYLGYGGFIRIGWRRRSSGSQGAQAITVLDCHHGWQAGRRPGAKVNQMELELGHSDADIILRGHSHERLAHTISSLRVGTKYARPWQRVVCHCGSYKMGSVPTKPGEPTHDTWELTRGFRPQIRERLGPPRITIRPSDGSGTMGNQASVTYLVTT